MSDDDNEHYLAKGSALIRGMFNVDPHILSEEEWAARFAEAVWLENRRLINFAKVVKAMFEPAKE